MFRLSLYPIGGPHYLVVLAAALVLLALLALGPGRARTTRTKRLALLGVRAAVIVMVILAMLRPTLIYTTTRKRAAVLVVLLDLSQSMTVPDEVNDRTRFDAMIRCLADAQPALAKLSGDFQVRAYAFDSEVHALEVVGGEIRLSAQPLGKETAIGHAIQAILRDPEVTGARLLAFVLLSDGAQNGLSPPQDTLPDAAAAQLKDRGERLFAVTFGNARGLGRAQDVAVTSLDANREVFVKNEVTVTGAVRVDGYVNRRIPVKLLYETSPGVMETVAVETLEVTTNEGEIPYTFHYVAETAGEHKLTVLVDEQPGELGTTNNSQTTFVNVLKGGLNVLYLTGFPPRPEQKFLRRALDASPDINVDTFTINAWRHETRPVDLAERLQPGKYEVYILGNLDADAFKEDGKWPLLELMAESVDRGAGLIMLGGPYAFGPGGYASTPLADVLPVTTDAHERQRRGDKLRQDMHLAGPVEMRPTPLGLLHFTLSLAADAQANQTLWQQLPPLRDGANKFGRTGGVKRGASVLAETAQRDPLLVDSLYGAGRVMAFASDSTWLWHMHGFDTAHRRFWRQIVLWLAKKDQAGDGNVWIDLVNRQVRPGQSVPFTVGVRAPTGEPIENATGTAEVQFEGKSLGSIPLVRAPDGTLSGSFHDAREGGEYSITVEVRVDGQPFDSARGRFQVLQQNLEMDNPAADTAAMSRWATLTGGRALAPEELPSLVKQLGQDTQDLEEQIEVKHTFWDSWPFFLVFVGLLGLEWYLRKRWGLV